MTTDHKSILQVSALLALLALTLAVVVPYVGARCEGRVSGSAANEVLP